MKISRRTVKARKKAADLLPVPPLLLSRKAMAECHGNKAAAGSTILETNQGRWKTAGAFPMNRILPEKSPHKDHEYKGIFTLHIVDHPTFLWVKVQRIGKKAFWTPGAMLHQPYDPAIRSFLKTTEELPGANISLAQIPSWYSVNCCVIIATDPRFGTPMIIE